MLPGATKYLASAAVKNSIPPTWAERLIAKADDVSVFDVLEDFFDIRVPREGVSFKSRCPFAFEHPDGGLDKGWRTYPGSNSSMCFVMHGRMGPVRLIQMRYGLRAVPAADKILDQYGLSRPKPWRERYTAVLIEVEQRDNRPVTGDPAHAAEALNMALRKEPLWTTRQFDNDVLNAMEIVLDRLDAVIESGDPEAVRRWYDKAEYAMLRIVREGAKT